MQASTRFILLIMALFVNRVTSIAEYGDTPWDYEEDKEKPEPRLWNGSKGYYEEHRYMVQVTRMLQGKWIGVCGGVFVTPQMVLTSNRCVVNDGRFNLDEIRIRYGTSINKPTNGDNKEFGDGIEHTLSGRYIIDIRQGDVYDPEMCLLRLKEPIKHREYKISLPEPGEDEAVMNNSSDLTLLAFGSSLGNDTKWRLKQVTVTGVKPCINQSETPYALCSRNQTFATCLGDEGSALVLETKRRQVLFGVLSYSNCCKRDTETSLKARLQECYIVYGRVSAVMPWILDTIMSKTRCHCLDKLDKMWLPEDISDPYYSH